MSDLLQKVAALVSGQPDVQAAYVFGSVARGQHTARSDVDVGVVLKPEANRGLSGAVAQVARVLERGLGREADVIDLESASIDLVHRVLREGVLVFEGDKARRVAFEVRARREYFDLVPYLREYRERRP